MGRECSFGGLGVGPELRACTSEEADDPGEGLRSRRQRKSDANPVGRLRTRSTKCAWPRRGTRGGAQSAKGAGPQFLRGRPSIRKSGREIALRFLVGITTEGRGQIDKLLSIFTVRPRQFFRCMGEHGQVVRLLGLRLAGIAGDINRRQIRRRNTFDPCVEIGDLPGGGRQIVVGPLTPRHGNTHLSVQVEKTLVIVTHHGAGVDVGLVRVRCRRRDKVVIGSSRQQGTENSGSSFSVRQASTHIIGLDISPLLGENPEEIGQ